MLLFGKLNSIVFFVIVNLSILNRHLWQSLHQCSAVFRLGRCSSSTFLVVVFDGLVENVANEASLYVSLAQTCPREGIDLPHVFEYLGMPLDDQRAACRIGKSSLTAILLGLCIHRENEFAE